ncbi:MAG: nucleotide exchange factor GrpE [Anaerolineaceae bacterium]|nr:nucleotide exchange factor GrpE [Anaerolineaceae bacterium]
MDKAEKNKAKNKEPEKEPQTPQEQSSGAQDDEQTMVALTFDEYDALEKKMETLEQDLESTKDSWLRSMAEFDNYKKRVQRDSARTYQDAMASTLKLFLSASDDLERALKNKPEGKDLDGWVNGIELILQKLTNQMKNQGVERMDIQPGDEFDPNVHEAITQEEHPDYKEGQIIEVVQPGYKISDRIIRPAMVRVAR